jgi:hypothetical protein
MSRKAKAEGKKKRLSKKRARKAAQKALYEARMRAGQNSKSKRYQLRWRKGRKARSLGGDHSRGPCGNIGCKHCNPVAWNLVTPNQYHLL